MIAGGGATLTADDLQKKTESVAGFSFRENGGTQYGQSCFVAISRADGTRTMQKTGTLTGSLLEITVSSGDSGGSVTVKARKKVKAWGRSQGNNADNSFNGIYNAGATITSTSRYYSVGVVQALVTAVDATDG